MAIGRGGRKSEGIEIGGFFDLRVENFQYGGVLRSSGPERSKNLHIFEEPHYLRRSRTHLRSSIFDPEYRRTLHLRSSSLDPENRRTHPTYDLRNRKLGRRSPAAPWWKNIDLSSILILRPVESKTRTYHVRVGSGRRTAGRRGREKM